MIGVHTPEFSFEHDVENVRLAVRQMGIDYPIAVDNDSAIWRAFENQYRRALYLIGSRGRVRHHHFGLAGPPRQAASRTKSIDTCAQGSSAIFQ